MASDLEGWIGETDARLNEVEARLDAFGDVKAELAHWIGEAKRYESWYRSADERCTRFLKERNEARATIVELKTALAEREEGS